MDGVRGLAVPVSDGPGEEGEFPLVGAAGDPCVLLAVASSCPGWQRFQVFAPDVHPVVDDFVEGCETGCGSPLPERGPFQMM